jgi:hypothetical protein
MNQNSNEFFKDSENRRERFKQIKSFHAYLATCRDKRGVDTDGTIEPGWSSIFGIFDRIQSLSEQNEQLEEQFYDYLLGLKYPCLDLDDNLIEMYIRYSILYLEDYDYNLKLKGLNLVEHLLNDLTSSKLALNMRSVRLYNSLLKYINDKDSRVFLGRIISVMCFLLSKIETKFARAEHCFAQHSTVVDSLLNGCYMSTDFKVKTTYMKSIRGYLTQMGDYSCRHLEKYLTVAFDFLESVKLLNTKSMNDESPGMNDQEMEVKQELAESSIDLVALLIDTCSLRIHAHARRILNFCIKVLYFYSLDVTNDFHESDTLNNPTLVKIRSLIASLFKLEKVRNQLYKEFQAMQSPESGVNENFRFLVQNL